MTLHCACHLCLMPTRQFRHCQVPLALVHGLRDHRKFHRGWYGESSTIPKYLALNAAGVAKLAYAADSKSDFRGFQKLLITV